MVWHVAFITQQSLIWIFFFATNVTGTEFALALRVVQAVVTFRFVGPWKTVKSKIDGRGQSLRLQTSILHGGANKGKNTNA